MRVLVVEDEQHLAEGLRKGLDAEGFATDVATNGTDGLWMAREHPYDAIVLDIMLPGINGYRVCATLREEGNWTPILMLTAKDGEFDEAEALDTGADDFVAKPFSYVALVARLHALIRRGAAERPAVLEAGDLRFDPGEGGGDAQDHVHDERAIATIPAPISTTPKPLLVAWEVNGQGGTRCFRQIG